MAQTSAEHLLEEGRKEGREEALKEAQTSAEFLLEEGIKKGRIEAWRTMLLTQLTEKFGAVPTDIEKRVRSLQDSETLERLLRQLIHARSLDELGL